MYVIIKDINSNTIFIWRIFCYF